MEDQFFLREVDPGFLPQSLDPRITYIVPKQIDGVEPGYDPYGVHIPIVEVAIDEYGTKRIVREICMPGKKTKQSGKSASPVPKSKISSRKLKQENISFVKGPEQEYEDSVDELERIDSKELEQEPIEKNNIQVEFKGKSLPFTLITKYCEVIPVKQGDSSSVVCILDLSDPAAGNRIRLMSVKGEVMLMVVNKERMYAVDLSQVITFTFKNYEFCILNVLQEGEIPNE